MPPTPERLEEEDVADRLRGREGDGEVARVLRDLLLADLALLGEALERRHDHRQELQDDRGGDVGHDPQREQRQALEAAAREEVEEAEDVRAREVLLQRLERVDVDAGRRDVGAEPVEQQHRRRECELAPDFRDAEGVEDRLKHGAAASPRSFRRCRRHPRSSRAPSREGVRAHRELRRDLAAPEHLHRVAARGEPRGA